MQPAALLSTICGLFAAVTWGSADFFATKASRNITAQQTSIFIAFVSALLYTVMFMFFPGHSAWNNAGIAYAAGAGLFMGAGLLMFYHGLEIGPVSIVSPVGSAYPLVTTLLVLILFKGHLTQFQIIGIVLVILGVWAASGLLTAKKSERKITSGVAYAFATLLLWGFGFALLGEAVAHLGWQKATFVDAWFELVAILVVSSILAKGFGDMLSGRFRNFFNWYIVLISAMQIGGLVVFNYGLTKAPSSAVITAVSASYPALTIFLALKHFKEKIGLIPLAGAFVTIAGVVVLSIS